MPSDVYGIIPVGMLPNPGICLTCGSNERDCVDFHITFDYEGAILICVSCIQELTNLEQLGFVRAAEVEQLKKEHSDLVFKNTALLLTRQELRDGVVAVLDTYDSTVDSLARDSVYVPENTDPVSEKLF